MSQTSCGFSDMDFDGDLDMFLACKGGFNRLMRNDRKNGNHWFKIELVGTESNRSAVGSRVTVTTNAQSQIREIQTGTGYWSQNSLTQHFGLGAASEIIEVKVRWPSGSIQTFHDVAVDQYVRLQECPLDCLCEGDINEDVDVNVSDLLEVIGSWGSCDDICPADLNLDGVVSVNDLLIVIEHWGPCWTLEPILGPAGRGLAPTPNSLPHPWRR